MNRIRAARSLVLGCALALGIGSVGHAQRTEVDTLVRGENVRLWAEPAPDTDLVAILQRGDEILITGDAELPDGSTMPVTAQTLGIAYDVFVPVELVETGETGWISEIFVDPRSFVPISSAGADVSTNIPRGTASVDNANTAAEDSGNAQQANRKNRRQNEKAAASDESAASATDVATTEADASQTKQQKRNKKNAASGDRNDKTANDAGAKRSKNDMASGALDDPADIGATLRGDGLAVTVGSAEFATELGSNTPKGGYKFLVVETRIKNVGDKDHTYASSDFSAQDGKTRAGFDSVFVLDDGMLDSGTLSPGEYVTGNVVFEVQETTRQALVKFDPDKLTEEDLFWAAP